jgi:hypothetical protein
MKAYLPATLPYSQSNEPYDRKKRHLDFSLRTWNDVAAKYNEKTGENITGKNAEMIAAHAIKKLRVELGRMKNAAVRKQMLDEIS